MTSNYIASANAHAVQFRGGTITTPKEPQFRSFVGIFTIFVRNGFIFQANYWITIYIWGLPTPNLVQFRARFRAITKLVPIPPWHCDLSSTHALHWLWGCQVVICTWIKWQRRRHRESGFGSCSPWSSWSTSVAPRMRWKERWWHRGRAVSTHVAFSSNYSLYIFNNAHMYAIIFSST